MTNADADTSLFSDAFPLDISEDLVPSRPTNHSKTVDLDFNGVLDPPLVLQTNAMQCGGQLWPGGMVLAEYLLDEKRVKELVGKTIVELGAGSGLVSLAIALRLRSTGICNAIHITDGLDVLIPLIQQNISLNQRHILNGTTVLATKLSWGEALPDDLPHSPDIVLAADCCYFEESFSLLLRTMQDLIGEDTICHFCYKKRRRADKDMIRMLRKVFEVLEVEGKWQREQMFLYKIRRKPQG